MIEFYYDTLETSTLMFPAGKELPDTATTFTEVLSTQASIYSFVVSLYNWTITSNEFKLWVTLPNEVKEWIIEKEKKKMNTIKCTKCGRQTKYHKDIAYGDYCLECRLTDKKSIEHDRRIMRWR